ncbi:hypothetical protein CHS0354_030064 [Potamilus streckersoni]|uniref:Uncharacterized protein n=1 Tax=Potamilus streckersoni TaxID=2493646 RepID=A0AAE0VG22_9BIVA|nr:hypothetical protein CHS0354_030064 [Potamilus streckersoni]
MLKKATVEIRDIKVTGISFGTEIITSDGKVFDVSKPNLEMLRYVKDLNSKNFDIKGEIPLDINFLRLMQAENINIDGQAGLLIKILGKGFTYEYEFKESYKIPKEEIQKKIDATIEEYLKKITGYFNNAGDTIADSLPEDISGLLKLLN